ncbi:decarboxylating 6-phosphogluconate dehydrogenase [Candidatus Woesearchaeota archaeon]|nr:decarboxylating 6-phosphogluconate dehydrogenase [Candidatus Woesearchaeota archaeon]
MKLGFIGLGRMGSNMTLNLLDHKHKVVGFDYDQKVIKKLSKKGMISANGYGDLISKLPKRKIIWLMVPAKVVDIAVSDLYSLLNEGDIVIDGGNSFYKDSIRRYKKFKRKGIHFLDCGTSGGINGARQGACMMVGGDKEVFDKVKILFKDMTVKDGYGYVGKSGSGHFVKAVHNGIEYGFMGALSEGFTLLEKKKGFDINLSEVSKIYANGSIIESRLTSWLNEAFNKRGFLDKIACEVPKGETEDEMKILEDMSDMPVLKASRKIRVNSRTKENTCGKYISAMRNLFGGHKVNKK